MKQKLTLLILALLTTVGAGAETLTLVTSEDVWSGVTFYTTSGTATSGWGHTCLSNASTTQPQVFINTNNAAESSGGFNCANGRHATGKTFYLNIQPGYKITGYSITFKSTSTSTTITAADGTTSQTADGSTPQTLNVTGLSTLNTSYSVSGAGNAIISAYTITYEAAEGAKYRLMQCWNNNSSYFFYCYSTSSNKTIMFEHTNPTGINKMESYHIWAAHNDTYKLKLENIGSGYYVKEFTETSSNYELLTNGTAEKMKIACNHNYGNYYTLQSTSSASASYIDSYGSGNNSRVNIHNALHQGDIFKFVPVKTVNFVSISNEAEAITITASDASSGSYSTIYVAMDGSDSFTLPRTYLYSFDNGDNYVSASEAATTIASAGTSDMTVKVKDNSVTVEYHIYYNDSEVTSLDNVINAIGDAPVIPSSLNRPLCNYKYYTTSTRDVELETITAGTEDVYVNCIWAGPFEISTAFNTATWYYLKLKDANYPTYVSANTPNVTLPTTNAGDRTTQWAFFGNPYDGLQIKNRAAGDAFVLGSAAAGSDDNNGGNTYATLQTAGSQTYELWFPATSSSYTNSFFLNNGQNYALNQRSTDNLAYWTGGKDAGSSFVVEAAPSDAEALEELQESHEIASANLDKPGFPTTEAYNTFRSTIEAFSSLEQWEEGIEDAVSTVKASVVYPNGTYYIKNRNTGCYAFITDDGELVPRIKIDDTEPHNNNNYLWTVTSNKAAGTCSIVSSLYSDVPFAKGADNYSNITAGNRTAITTLSTELFGQYFQASGAFYLNGAHNNNTYTGNGEGNGNSHIVSWNSIGSWGSQWIFEPVDLGTEWTVTVTGLENGGQDAVTLSDGTIVNLGTGTVYLNDTPTAENIAQSDISGYSILDGSIVVDGTNHTITVTYSPSYAVLCSNYISDNSISTKLSSAGNTGYPKTSTTSYSNLNTLVNTTFADGEHEYTASDYSNLQTYYAAYLAETDIVKPSSGNFYRIKSSANWTYANRYLIGSNDESQYTCDIEGNTGSSSNSIWYYNGTTLYGYGNGGYPVVNNNNFLSVATSVTTPTSVSFQKANKSEWGTFNVIFKGNSNANRYLYTSDGYANAGGSTDTSYGYNFNVEEVNTLPVIVSSVGYATLYAPVALTIPTGVQAYYISSLTSTEATLTEISTTIPAETAVILKASAGTYNFEIATAAAFDGTNKLDGQIAAFSVSADDVTNKVYYTLQQNVTGDAVGLYPKTAAGSIAGFKAYLPASNLPAAGVKGFTFIFDDDATGIKEINGQWSNGQPIYNLAGQRVNKMQKGINIVNGKKILF